MNDSIFSTATRSNLKFTNHNEADYASFRDFNKNINELFEKKEKAAELAERKRMLKLWDDNVSARWRGASLSKIKTEASERMLQIIAKEKLSSFFINGEAGSGKTHYAYSVLRKYIGAGLVKPSQIKIISESELLSYGLTGFIGRGKLDDALNPKFKVYVIDSVGEKESYDARREVPIIEQVIDHVYSNSLAVIFTGDTTASSYSNILSESSESKLLNLVSDKTITLKETGFSKPQKIVESKIPLHMHFDG